MRRYLNMKNLLILIGIVIVAIIAIIIAVIVAK